MAPPTNLAISLSFYLSSMPLVQISYLMPLSFVIDSSSEIQMAKSAATKWWTGAAINTARILTIFFFRPLELILFFFILFNNIPLSCIATPSLNDRKQQVKTMRQTTYAEDDRLWPILLPLLCRASSFKYRARSYCFISFPCPFSYHVDI